MENDELLEHILDGREKPTNLPYGTLKNITNDFAEDREIGKGGFATIYKGVLQNGNVAVKRILNSKTIDDKMFHRETNCLLATNHQNVVRFLGFCANTYEIAVQIEGSSEHIYAEVRERLLCFDYISNGTLQEHITDELRGLEWDTRCAIIRGICEGLHHLHKEKSIYHMDLKPENILLDNHMLPKLTDFGISRLDSASNTTSKDRHVSLGYCAPEYLQSGDMSFKSDMYSLGIIIIQLVTGEKGILANNYDNVLRRWRSRLKKSGKETPLVYQQVAKCIQIGLQCQEIDPCKRPFIWDIINNIRELTDVHGETSNADEPTFGQIRPYSEDDMLGIKPLKLHFHFELNKQISSTLELTNETDAYIAFNIKTTSPLPYSTKPSKDILPPRSKCSVKITLESQEKAPKHMQQAYTFIVLSTKVKDCLVSEDLTEDTFEQEAGNMVDEVNLDVVFESEQLNSEVIDVHKLEPCFPIETDNLTPIAFSLEFLKAITHDFSAKSELGRGGYGVVYKGVLPSGKFIAVKKLFGTQVIDDEVFQTEINNLRAFNHQNIARFVGYCADSSWQLMDQARGKPIWTEIHDRFLCFEYVLNKSLDKYISDESSGLEWDMRYDIITGICSGLHYLHEECNVVHMDIKPGNILMDAAMMPKISDLTLPSISSNTHDLQTMLMSMNHAGSIGYMAPELSYDKITKKSDIFSVGVTIIELITGRRDYPEGTNTSVQEYFIEKVLGNWRKIFLSTSKYNKSTEKYMRQVKQCICVALKCVDGVRQRRPAAKDILRELSAIGL